MSGLAAIVRRAPDAASDTLVSVMLGRMAHYPWLQSTRVAAGQAALGLVSFERCLDRGLWQSADGRFAAVLDGELFDSDAQRRALGVEHDPSAQTDAGLLLAGWRRDGDAFLARLSGEFAAVIWDADHAAMHVITDRFGLRSLYVRSLTDGLVVGSEVKAVLAGDDAAPRWSQEGVAQFFAFGHFYGDRTLLDGVRAVPAATRASYSLHDGRYEETRYWQLAHGRVTGRTADLAHAFEDAFVSAVERRARPTERLGLSLSGGLDARTILGVMPDGVTLHTVSLGMEGSLDHRSAAEMAAIAGVPHHAYVLDADFLSSFETHLRQMVHLTDGHYLDQGIVMPTMTIYRDLGIEQLLRGHGGELVHMRKAYAFSLDEAALRAASETDIEAWLFSHLTGYMLGGVPDDLFTFDVREAARESLRAALLRCPASGEPVDRVWALFLNERIHRETTLSMHTFGCFATVRQPYLDNDVIDILFSMPAPMKLGDELQTTLLRHRKPAFLAVTNANTGARLGAGPLETALARFRMRVFAKLGVKGYQPYERLGLWLRRELRPFIEQVLVSGRVLDESVIRPDVVRRIVSEHNAQQKNHTFLIMSLLIFALGREMRTSPAVPPRA